MLLVELTPTRDLVARSLKEYLPITVVHIVLIVINIIHGVSVVIWSVYLRNTAVYQLDWILLEVHAWKAERWQAVGPLADVVLQVDVFVFLPEALLVRLRLHELVVYCCSLLDREFAHPWLCSEEETLLVVLGLLNMLNCSNYALQIIDFDATF